LTASTQQPSIGRIVHYVSYGTPGGEYGKECRAAVITGVSDAELHLETDVPQSAHLCVLNPTGVFFKLNVPYHDGAETEGSSDCPNAAQHGDPFRYCGCGWMEASHAGGSWHWPERV
jgi:hypothetical protein